MVAAMDSQSLINQKSDLLPLTNSLTKGWVPYTVDYLTTQSTVLVLAVLPTSISLKMRI